MQSSNDGRSGVLPSSLWHSFIAFSMEALLLGTDLKMLMLWPAQAERVMREAESTSSFFIWNLS